MKSHVGKKRGGLGKMCLLWKKMNYAGGKDIFLTAKTARLLHTQRWHLDSTKELVPYNIL